MLEENLLHTSPPRKSKSKDGVSYVYAEYDNDPIVIRSPSKVFVSKGVTVSKNKSLISVDLLKTSEDDGSNELYQLFSEFDAFLLNKAVKKAQQWFSVDLCSEEAETMMVKSVTDGKLELKLTKQGKIATKIFLSSNKEPVDADEYLTPGNLQNSNLRFIAHLDGVYIDPIARTFKPVWFAQQLMVSKEAQFNPFGQEYVFLDDDSYDSLED